jgi:SET domain-containing protein
LKQPLTDAIEANEHEYLYCETSQIPSAGMGLFTAIPIYKNEIISYFKGELLSKAEAKVRALKGENKFFILMPNKGVLDCMFTDCFAKYANDANGLKGSNYKNNAKIVLDDQQQVCLQATRKLKPNEEIFCSYGKSYWAPNQHTV